MNEATQQFGKYRILGELGRGGFATVYRAVDTTLDREVALKILHPQLLADSTFVQRFRQEARTLAALRHPHIVTVYEVSEAEGRLYIATELAHGVSLARAIAERGRIPWAEALELLKTICAALDYAHSRGIVHRDLKPANVLLDPERGPLLTDFGFARIMGESSVVLSMSGGVAGTPGYIAPEVWDGSAAEAPADIYALGCIAHEMLAGDVLFRGQTPMQVMRAHDRGPAFPEAWPDGVPAGVEAALRKALARDPAARYPSAMALWHALNDLEATAQKARENEAQAAVVAQWRAEAEAALAAGELSAARMAIGRWLAVAPDDPAAKAARAKLERLTTRPTVERQARPPKVERARAEERSIESSPNKTVPAESAYSQILRGKSKLVLALGGIAVILLLVLIAARAGNSRTPGGSPTAAPIIAGSPAPVTSASAIGGATAAPTASGAAISMDQLVEAAKQEGALNVIALPHDWVNYGEMLDNFKKKYGLEINEINPDGSSGQEIEAIKANKDNKGPQAPDVIDVGPSFGPSSKQEGLLQPHKVATWDTIPNEVKDAEGYWYGDYYGVISFAVNKDAVKNMPQDWADLLKPEYKGQVALAGDPRTSNQAIRSIHAAALANGGSLENAQPGLDFFAKLNQAGNLVPVIGKQATLATGETPILITWDYQALGYKDALKDNPPIEVVVPKSGVLGGMYVQAISAFAPHPNAAKLWMEYLFSDEGQLIWLKGYVHPIRYNDLLKNNKIPADLAAKLPPAELYAKAVFPKIQQQDAALKIIIEGWDKTVGVNFLKP